MGDELGADIGIDGGPQVVTAPADPVPAWPDARPAKPEPVRAELAEAILDRFDRLDERVAEFHRRAEHRESVIDRLHQENSELRSGVRSSILEPVIADLLRLHDALTGQAERLTADETTRPAGDTVATFADDVRRVLERCGVEVLSTSPGDRFDPTMHNAAGVVPTDDEDLDNTVAEPLASGIVDLDTRRVRRPARARFYRATEPT